MRVGAGKSYIRHEDDLILAGVFIRKSNRTRDGYFIAGERDIGERHIDIRRAVILFIAGGNGHFQRQLLDGRRNNRTLHDGVVGRSLTFQLDTRDGYLFFRPHMLVAERSRAVQRSDVVARNCRREGEVGDGLDGAVIDFVLDVDQGGERLAGNRKGGGGVGEGVVGIEAAFRNDGVGTDAGVIAGDGADGRGNNR